MYACYTRYFHGGPEALTKRLKFATTMTPTKALSDCAAKNDTHHGDDKRRPLLVPALRTDCPLLLYLGIS